MENTQKKGFKIPPQQMINAWHESHQASYKQFLKNFEAMSLNNLAFLQRLVDLVGDNIPAEFMELLSYLSLNDEERGEQPLIVTKYEGLIEECLSGETIICVNLLSGEIVSLREKKFKPKVEQIIISMEDFLIHYKNMPRMAKAMLNEAAEILFQGMDFNGLLEDLKEACGQIDTPEELSETDFAQFSLFFLFAYVVIFALLSLPAFLKNMAERGLSQNDDFAYCLYYFIAMDHGIKKMFAKVVSMTSQMNLDTYDQVAIDEILRKFIKVGKANGYENMAQDIEPMAENAEPDVCELILGAASVVKPPKGNKADYRSLDQLLIAKGKDEVKVLIKEFVEKEQMINIAILYYILVHQQLMEECPMVTFCNALALSLNIPAFDSNDIKKRYNTINIEDKALDPDYALQFDEYRSIRWRRMQNVYQHWNSLFEKLQ